MPSTSSARAAVLDLFALDSLEAFPRDLTRVVLLFQASPMRRALVASHFREAEIVVADPRADGPWQSSVENYLADLARTDVLTGGVPVLDCFRAIWREELASLYALRVSTAGARRVVVASGGPAQRTLMAIAGRGGIDDVAAVPAKRRRRTGVLAKLRRTSPRGLAMALSARLDPTHARRSSLRRRPRLTPTPTVLVSSYVNAARAALEAHAALGGGPCLFFQSGPGALTRVARPKGMRVVSLSAAASLARRQAAVARRDGAQSAMAALSAWGDGDPWAPWPAISTTSFGEALGRVLLPEVLTAVVGLQALLRETGARRLVVGDEFSFVDRAALHLARRLGLETVSRQHGVLDSHYVRDPILADRHLAWDAPTAAWLREKGAVGSASVELLARRPSASPRSPAGRRRTIVVFLQPVEMIGIPARDWMEETLSPLVRVAQSTDARLVMKPHPLQTRTSVVDQIPTSAKGHVEVVTGTSARDLLVDAAVAVTLDSSVALDCREAQVPCLSTAWYAGAYARDLARLEYVRACATPEALETAVRDRLQETT